MEKDRSYHKRSLAETETFRYKQLLSPKLTLRNYNAQVSEELPNVKAMNKVIGLGMLVQQQTY
ncbi:Mobile element protein [Candidatus Enterovibrio escicola]|uniref:Mobile element protein n=1 Tax=Candidatus Enterovibrio escicola TaxID=1927127 RepID=A0A2A5T5G2_9GAMM|nr:Mobile element protein [Candidatus Enterovibrio escacola]